MAAAMILQLAAGGALSSPAAVDFSCRMVAMAAPRLLRLTQRNYHASSPHRPAVAGSRGFSSYDKFASQLKEEEDKMRTKKELAVALMNDTPSSGTGDHKEEVKSVSNLLSLLGAPAPAPANGGATADQLASQLLNERRSALEKKKNALLIELLNGDGQCREQKMSEVVAAGRQLLDDLAAHEERRSHLAFTTELRSLQQTVESNKLFSARDYKKAMDAVEFAKLEVQSANASVKAAKMEVQSANASVKAAKMEVQSANAYVQSLRSDVRRLETGMTAAKSEAKEALRTAESTNEELKTLQGTVKEGRKEAEAAMFVARFVFWSGIVGGITYLIV